MTPAILSERGICKDADPELFFAPDAERPHERANRVAAAKLICQRCPVIRECLEYSLQSRARTGIGQKYGVWGGMDEDERALEHRRRLRKRSAA